MMEEAHRQGLQIMLLMYMSSFRSRSSSSPDDVLGGYRRSTLQEIFEKFKQKNNYFMDKARLSQVRQQFKDEQTKRSKLCDKHKVPNLPEIILTDAYPPMNHVGYTRWKEWHKKVNQKDLRKNKEDFEKKKHEQPAYLDLESAVESENQKHGYKGYNAEGDWEYFYDQNKREGNLANDLQAGYGDMLNIMLSINYLTGFADKLNQAKIKEQGKYVSQ